MKNPGKTYPIVMAMLLLILPVSGGLSSDSAGSQTAPAGVSMPDRGSMKLIGFFETVEEVGLAFFVALYDDPRTRWEVDYMEVYDEEGGELLLVSWIDRYGVKRMAVDRALLDEESIELEGVLVFLTMGTPL